MTLTPLAPVDAAWFHMDGTANTAVVTVLVTTRRSFDFQAVRSVLESRLAPIRRFRCRVVERGIAFDSPCWEDVGEVDIDQHVHHRALPSPADEAALLDLVSDLASQSLPLALPLWQAHVVDGPGARGALVLRYHHCIGDGAAMVDVARRIFDQDQAASPPPARAANDRDRLAGIVAPLLGAIRDGVGGIGEIAQALLRPGDPVSSFKGRFVARQRVARSAGIPLGRFRAIAHAAGASINDVVVAALAGALRTYLAGHGQATDQDGLHAMMPVNLRPPERAHDTDNEFGLAILALPVEIAQARDRLVAAQARIAALKHSSEAVVMRWLLEAFGRGPKAIQQVAQHLFGSKTSLVLTNVPGPVEPLRLAGRTIDRMMFWVPHPGEDLGLGLSVFSYRGRLCLGVIGDAVRVPDPERIARLFEREVAVLAREFASSPDRLARPSSPLMR